MSMLTGLKLFSLTCKYVFYRTELNAEGDSIEFNFEGLKVKQTKRIELKSRSEKWGYLSSYHVYLQSYSL